MSRSTAAERAEGAGDGCRGENPHSSHHKSADAIDRDRSRGMRNAHPNPRRRGRRARGCGQQRTPRGRSSAPSRVLEPSGSDARPIRSVGRSKPRPSIGTVDDEHDTEALGDESRAAEGERNGESANRDGKCRSDDSTERHEEERQREWQHSPLGAIGIIRAHSPEVRGEWPFASPEQLDARIGDAQLGGERAGDSAQCRQQASTPPVPSPGANDDERAAANAHKRLSQCRARERSRYGAVIRNASTTDHCCSPVDCRRRGQAAQDEDRVLRVRT